MSIVASSLVASVSVSGVESAIGNLLKMGRAADGAGSTLKTLVAGGALIAGAAIVGIGIKAVQMAGNFQESMTQLVTGAGESKANIDMVSNGILNMAVATGTSTDQLSQGMYMNESAGYHGAAGLAVLQAAAEGAKVGNASLADVANGVTTAMTDYASSNLTAAQATNFMVSVVANGKTHMTDLANSMSTILPTAGAVGVSLKDVGGAMATMTGEGTGAAQASTYLRQLLMALASPAKAAATSLKAIGLTTAQVSTDMKKSLPDTLQMIMAHLKETYAVGSPQYMTALKNISGGVKQMQGMLELTGSHLKTFAGNVKSVGGAMNTGKGAIAGWSDVQGDFNFKIAQAKEVVETLMIRIGQYLLPVVTNLMNIIIPLITQFSNWITSSGVLGTAIQVLSGVFTMLGGYITPIIKDIQQAVQHFFGFGDAAKQTSDKVIGAVKPISDTVRHLQGMFADLTGGGGKGAKASPFASLMADAKQIGSVIITDVKPAFAEISQIVGGTFAAHMKTAQGIIADLSTWFHSSLLPAIHSAMPGFKALAGVLIDTVVPGLFKLWAIGQKVIDEVLPPLMHVIEAVIPVAIKLGGIIAGGLAAALKFLMPYIIQAASAIGQFAGEIATRVAPILVNFFHNISSWLDTFMAVWKAVWPYLAPILKGVFDEIVGIVKIAWALVSGIIKIGLDLLSGNWSQAWTDLKSMLSGVWDGIKQVISGGIEVVLGDIHAFVGAIVGFFQWLWDTLTGHSIIPDMVKSIITWFSNLVSGAIGWIENLVTGIKDRITEFAAAVIVTIQSWVQQIIQWIVNLHDQAVAKAHDVVSGITGVFTGLLSVATTWGKDLIQNLIGGITSMAGNIGNAVGGIANTIKGFLHFSKPDTGPLADFDTWMPDFGDALSAQLKAQAPKLQAAMQVMVQPLAATGSSSAAMAFPAMAQNPMTQVANSLAQGQNTQVIFQIDKHQFARVVMPLMVQGIRNSTGVRGF